MPIDIKKDDYFKIDPEAHLVGESAPFEYFPGVHLWWNSIAAIKRPMMLGLPKSFLESVETQELQKDADPASLLKAMDKYGVDIACLLPESMMDTTGYTGRFCSNGEMAKVVEANPDRFMYQPNLSPIKFKGVKNTIWELEYWVKEKGAKIFKFYPPEDTCINDPDLWPFYRKAEELDIVLDIHTGFGWCAPGKFSNGLPMYLDDVARDFPRLKIVAFHMGYPQCDDLNMVAMAHKNVYVCISLVVTWALSSPRKFAKMLGEALRWVGPDKIIWGSDDPALHIQMACSVRGFRDFQMPQDLQEQYGYPEVTDEDKRKIFGENLAGLLGIDISRRRVAL
ncbi:MAG: amidohydrolase [Deltaproteobacteria bacterium]|nr:amidohydrolase [Deltaproteobacteria bacterium]